MKLKKIAAVFTATVMAFLVVTSASAEDDFDVDHSSAYVEDFGGAVQVDIESLVAVYDNSETIRRLLNDYPDGSYFTRDGKACESHKTCTWSTPCNCINYDDSIQCAAFAKYVFYCLKGYKWDSGTTTYKNIDDATAETARKALADVSMGTYVKVTSRSSGVEHSLAVMSTSNSNITVYDANSLELRTDTVHYRNCQVRLKIISWSDFAQSYKKIIKVVQ